MKKNICTIICAIMMLIPWTILPLRGFEWALQSPAAAIVISSYAVFMIISGIFTISTYVGIKAQNTLMKICLVVNSLYMLAGAGVLVLMLIQR